MSYIIRLLCDSICIHDVRLKCLMCFLLVTCPSLTSPTKGMISCLLGGDNIPNPEENCTFTCNTGYELMGTGTRYCQNDGSWSGSESTCIGE